MRNGRGLSAQDSLMDLAYSVEMVGSRAY